MSTPFDALAITQSPRPYLDRIDYSHDDLATLRERLIARLPQALPGWNPALADQAGDYGVLLAELFAHMAAILHAYADQRANESFLRTATLTRSLMDLAQLVDYRLGQGAAATTLQAFFAKADKPGQLPAGFRLQAQPAGAIAPLSYETDQPLDVHPSRNRMRLHGHNVSNRRLRLRASAAAPQDTRVRLSALHGGLKAGIPIVLHSFSALVALPLSAITTVDGATQVAWAAGEAPHDADLPIADLSLFARPQQSARHAAAERADEITLGHTVVPVLNAGLFTPGVAVLVRSGAFQQGAVVLASTPRAGEAPAGDITLNRGLAASLRRSDTEVLAGALCGEWGGTERAGATHITRNRSGPGSAVALHTGDTLLVVDAGGIEIATVAQTSADEIYLAAPLTRALRPTRHVGDAAHKLRYFVVRPQLASQSRSAARVMRLGDLANVYQGGQTVMLLDKTVDAFDEGSVVALGDGELCSAHTVVRSRSLNNRTELTLAGLAPRTLKVATLRIHGAFEHRMRVAGHDRSEATLAAGAAQLELAGLPLGLAPGMTLVIADGQHAEGMRITQVRGLRDRVQLSLARPLDHAYALGDAVVYGNVAAITQGQGGAEEILGGGDPAAAPQRFELQRAPLAWVPDPASPRGAAPAIEVFVNGERWTRVDTLADSGPNDRHLCIEADDRERASVVFGDGVHGAAPPSGRNNITARYRTGHSATGNVAAQAIAKMPQPAAFLDKTFNPLPASGGADRDGPDLARQQTRLRVQTLDRAVTVADHAHLALTFSGVGKAIAASGREGRGAAARPVIAVTCASHGGHALSTPQKEALLAFLSARSAQPDRIRLRDHRPWPVSLALNVTVRPNHRQAAVQQALLAAFSQNGDGFFAFERRSFGADIALSEVYAVAERIEGVDHVLATRFQAEGNGASVADRIAVPGDALATGTLTLQLNGGLT